MGLLTTAECLELLTSLGGGDSVTLAGITTPCIMSSADGGRFTDASPGVPVEGLGDAIAVTVATGALAALAQGSTITFGGASYRVDHVVRGRNAALTHFIAYPA